MPPKHSPSAQGFEDKPFEGQVFRTQPGKEKITVNSATGYDDVAVGHPMLGPNSWIRTMPERGARVVTVSTAGGQMRRIMVGYSSRAAAEYIKRYQAGSGLYKELKPGEWDLMTPGVSHVHGTVDGKLFLRGGLVHGELDPKKLHARWRAPTHRRDLHLQEDGAVYDEERFGVVIRDKSDSERHRWLRAPSNSDAFAKEYYRVYGHSDNRLAVVMEGDCFDDEGDEIKHDTTGKRVRALREYYDDDGDAVYQVQIDNEGSILLDGDASKINVQQNSADTSMDLKKLTANMLLSLNLEAGTSADVTARTTGRFSGSAQTIIGPDPAPINPIIKGQQFVTTVMVPFINALIAHFELSSKPPPPGGPGPKEGNDFGADYKKNMNQIAQTLKPILAALVPSLSLNSKVSQ
jgi:hypothetical protein